VLVVVLLIHLQQLVDHPHILLVRDILFMYLPLQALLQKLVLQTAQWMQRLSSSLGVVVAEDMAVAVVPVVSFFYHLNHIQEVQYQLQLVLEEQGGWEILKVENGEVVVALLVLLV